MQKNALSFIVLALIALSPFSANAQWITTGTNISNTNTGNVGIGTTTPGSRLSLGTQVTTGIGNANFLRIYDSGTNSYGWGMNTATGEFAQTAGAAGFLSYYTGNTEKMRITTAGIGIGVASPASKLDVANPTSDASILRLSNGNASAVYDFSRNTTTGTLSLQGNQVGFNNIALAPTSGNVGVGTTTPAAKLDVNGNANINGSLKLKGSITSDGDICIGTCP